MAQLDWTEMPSSLTTASVIRGVTAGITAPPSVAVNAFVYGFNSLVGDVAGCVAKYVNLAGWIPTGSGPAVPDGTGSIRGCVRRVSGSGNTGFTPFLFFCAQNTSVNDVGYMLGLSDASPYHIVLGKGPLLAGLVEDPDNDSVILAEGSDEYDMADALWHHLRLDCLVEPNGDVLIKVFENDLVAHPLGNPPTWTAVAGISSTGVVDDVTQILSGSAPLWGGYCGFGFSVSNSINRRAAFDGIEAYRAT
jgi:hypothetical protein